MEEGKMTLGIAVILRNMTKEMLIKTVDGRETERKLPFRLTYALNKNLMKLEKDARAFEAQKMVLMAEYGEVTEDEQSVEIKDEEKKKKYEDALKRLWAVPVQHDLYRLNPEDFKNMQDDDLTFPPELMQIYIGYLVDDPELIKDIETKIDMSGVKEE